MVKINRNYYFFSSILLFFISCIGILLSLNGYLSFFKSSDVINFSWALGFFIFASPILFYFSNFCFFSAMRNKFSGVNKKIEKVICIFAFFGAIFSFVFSGYVDIIVREKGYQQCPKKSLGAPRKYVKNMSLC